MSTIKVSIREQYDHRKGLWKIVKKTTNGSGGWKRFGTGWYYDKQEAEQAIDKIIRNYPQMYERG